MEDSADAEITLVEAMPVEDTISDAKVQADSQSTAVESSDIILSPPQGSEDDSVEVAAETTFIDPVSVAPKLADDLSEELALTETSKASDPELVLQTTLEETSSSIVEPRDDAIVAVGSFIPESAAEFVDIPLANAEGIDSGAKEEVCFLCSNDPLLIGGVPGYIRIIGCPRIGD
jgi:hypothetical protein